MFALIFVIVVAAGIVALVIGVQKNKKKVAEPEVASHAKEVKFEVKLDDILATVEQHQALAEAKKEIVKAKKPKMAADKPAVKAPKKKPTKSKS